MKFFKPEDFESDKREDWVGNGISVEAAARIANSKLEREGKRVYSMSTDSRYWEDPSDKDLQDAPERCDLSGLIINIESLVKNQSLEEYIEWLQDYYSKTRTVPIIPKESCTHPKEKVSLVKQYLEQGLVLGEKSTDCIGSGYLCECGVKVVPNGFTEEK